MSAYDPTTQPFDEPFRNTPEAEEWTVVTRPMLIDGQRPEYCPCIDEVTHPTCSVCPATVKGDDIVGGVCQALRSGRRPIPLVQLVVVPR